MKKIFAILSALTLSGCYITIEQMPAQATNCTAVYGYASLHRTQNKTVRVKEYARHC